MKVLPKNAAESWRRPECVRPKLEILELRIDYEPCGRIPGDWVASKWIAWRLQVLHTHAAPDAGRRNSLEVEIPSWPHFWRVARRPVSVTPWQALLSIGSACQVATLSHADRLTADGSSTLP